MSLLPAGAQTPAEAEAPSALLAPAMPGGTRRAPARRSAAAGLPARADAGQELLRKPVNALAIVPQSKKITPLFRKSYNVMLHLAQEQGMERDIFRAPISAVLAGLDFDSNDTGLVKRHLRAMATTAVEWQSPTTGEGASWAISGLIGHAEIKREGGQNWLEWSYSVRLKQELLEPSVFARLSLEMIAQLRSHGAIALYEICSRYRDVGRTSRQAWSWWRPVLSGKPETDKQKQLEYRFFKRDVIKRAIDEVNAITDIEVELLEYKAGRFIADLQFSVRRKQQVPLPLVPPGSAPQPLDLTQVVRATALGVDEERAEQCLHEFGEAPLKAALDVLERRVASAFPQPLRDPQRYLRAVLEGARGGPDETPAAHGPGHDADAAGRADLALREVEAKRRVKWTEEWLRRRRDGLADEIAAMGEEAQQALCDSLLADMAARNVHPSIRKRLQTSGWQHAMVLHEMLRFYANASIGEQWDQPSAQQLLDVAAQLGDTAESAGLSAG
ncbi:replication initiation protein [Aquabacterium sp. OR-4]|uniref:replication initiation protein n=1 Tax=Aquabacterium sp. OR-4 TaxID=2978127 RepID=UPI0028CA47CD|nr:replication initiation protein [Aquabacterium sp. OR-4]MDT7838872.1 replication initiation protein [Aquabacterium sp. OR-4]